MSERVTVDAAAKIVRDVRSLSEQRGIAERTIESTYALRRERAEAALRAAQSRSKEQLEAALESLESEYSDATSNSRATRDRDRAETDAARSKAVSMYTARLERTNEKLAEREREARWLAETVYDAERSAAKADRSAAADRATRQRKRLAEAMTAAAEWRSDYPVLSARRADAALRSKATADPGETPVDDVLEELEAKLAALRAARGPKLAAVSTLGVMGLVITGGAAAVGYVLAEGAVAVTVGAGVAGLVIACVSAFMIRKSAAGTAERAFALIGERSRRAERGIERDEDAATAEYETRRKAAKSKHDAELREHMSGIEADRAKVEREATERAAEVETEFAPKLARIEEVYEHASAGARRTREHRERAARRSFESTMADAARAYDESLASAVRERDEAWAELRDTWLGGMASVRSGLEQFNAHAESWRDWDASAWDVWQPAGSAADRIAPVVRVGTVPVDRRTVPGGIETEASLSTDVPESFEVPVALRVEGGGSLLIEHAGEPEAVAAATQAVQNAMLRLLTVVPAGKLRFTIVDPVALGQNYAGFMHLADFSEALVSHRIWTDPRHIDERLGELTEHMENVIQKYLRNEFPTIDAYNERAGEIAEPYRYLVISDFPVNIEEGAARRLSSIVSSGARCGVHTIIIRDTRELLPKGVQEDDLRRGGVTLRWDRKAADGEGGFVAVDTDTGQLFGGHTVQLDTPPDDDRLTSLVKRVGEAAVDASRVEVPFRVVSPGEGEWWSRSASEEVRVPLGRSGATKLQELSLGRGTAQHALIAGKTGSGKSTLLHVLVTNLALWYSPDEVEFYLVDFKKGVEFKAYATRTLPHARAVAIESDREFGLSVLQRVDAELKRRGDMFRDVGVQNVQGYRDAKPGESMPRVLLIIDEFQELFVEDDKVSQDASLLLDRLVRQGRAFGIHLVLGSQTLGGAYGLARSTLNQMAVRIALQCAEADSYLILSEDNAAARLLARPGEAIYNDDAGRIEGNSPFQIVWLPDRERDAGLDRVVQLAHAEGGFDDRESIVFEGNAPAKLSDNRQLRRAWSAAPDGPIETRGWLGEAISIKEPTSVALRRQSGSNVLIVGQQPDLARGVLGAMLIGIAGAARRTGGMIYLADGTPEDDSQAGALAGLARSLSGPGLGSDVRTVGFREMDETVMVLAAEVERRLRDGDADEPTVVLAVFGLQRYRNLRKSDDFGFSMDDDSAAAKPDKAFSTVLRDGPGVGVHVIAWCDTLANIERTIDRQAMREFEQRVLFQMSATDSTALIDLPAASRLGPNRGMLFVEETGVMEKFRPYAFPADLAWLDA